MSVDTIYQMITDRILTMLEEGTVPWRKPWNAGGAPGNLVSGKPYRGVNVFLLGTAPYASPWWLSFKQAKTLGGSVKKGEKGSVVIFWKIDKATDPTTGELRTVPMLRYYRVWNLDQCEGVRVPKGRITESDGPPLSDADRIAAAEKIAASYVDGPTLEHAGGAAYYRPTTDTVTMPPLSVFHGAAEYYSTLFHELGHSTGHASRLARFDEYRVHEFGSAEYGREELIAEMTSAFLCGEAGILPATITNSAAYIAGWRKAIKGDPRAVIVAAGAAQKAADRIVGRTSDNAVTADADAETPATGHTLAA